MSDWRLGTGAILLALGFATVAVMQARSRRLLLDGQRVEGTVTRVHPYRTNPYPPYWPAAPYLEVRYEHDGKIRGASIWLRNTKTAGYHQGQPVTLIVGRGLFRPRVRTEAEDNLLAQAGVASLGMGVAMILLLSGAVLLFTGLTGR